MGCQLHEAGLRPAYPEAGKDMNEMTFTGTLMNSVVNRRNSFVSHGNSAWIETGECLEPRYAPHVLHFDCFTLQILTDAFCRFGQSASRPRPMAMAFWPSRLGCA